MVALQERWSLIRGQYNRYWRWSLVRPISQEGDYLQFLELIIPGQRLEVKMIQLQLLMVVPQNNTSEERLEETKATKQVINFSLQNYSPIKNYTKLWVDSL